jgi:hypothetical protein
MQCRMMVLSESVSHNWRDKSQGIRNPVSTVGGQKAPNPVSIVAIGFPSSFSSIYSCDAAAMWGGKLWG